MPQPPPRRLPAAPLAAALAAGLAVGSPAGAATVVPDSNGVTLWDINDAANGAVDDGSIATGNTPFGAYTKITPFDGFGALRATVATKTTSIGGGHLLRGFGLTFDG